MWLSKYAESLESPPKTWFSLSFTPNLLLVPPFMVMRDDSQVFSIRMQPVLHFSVVFIMFPSPTISHCSLTLLYVVPYLSKELCLPAPGLSLSLGTSQKVSDCRVYTSKEFLWSLWSTWTQCCDSSTQAESASHLPAPKLCLFKLQDNWHVCSAWPTGAIHCFPNCGFFILEAQEVPLALGRSMKAAHWRFDGGGGWRAWAICPCVERRCLCTCLPPVFWQGILILKTEIKQAVSVCMFCFL